MGRTIVSYIGMLIVLAVALKLLVIFLEPRLTFFPFKGQQSTPLGVGIPFREIPVRTADGEIVYAWLLQPSTSQAEVIFFHGNGGNLSLWQDFLVEMYAHSLTVLALDYRGYGRSSGSPTEQGLYRDTEALLNTFWQQIHRPHQKVVYWGRSLGGPIAAFATTVHPPHGLILESTFSDKDSLLNHYLLLKVLGFFSTYRFPTLKFLDEFSAPVLIVHGEEDEVVPFVEGETLFARLQGPKSFHAVAGAHHNDLHLVSPAGYWNRIRSFIEAADKRPD